MRQKNYVNKLEEPLRCLCNEAFWIVRRVVPEFVSDSALAFVSGAVGGYAIAAAGGIATKAIGGHEALEKVVSHSVVATAVLPLASYVIAPKHVRRWRQEHPTYSSGVLGVMCGAMLRGLQEIL